MERLVSLLLVTLFCFGTHGIPTAESPKASAKSGKCLLNDGSLTIGKCQHRGLDKNCTDVRLKSLPSL